MKKIFLAILAVFLMPNAFPQQNANIRFENRKSSGYFNITQVNLLMGNRQIAERTGGWPGVPHNYYTRSEFQITPSITMTNGWMFNEHWAAGIGVGFEMFGHTHFPVFADIRYTLRSNTVSPFFAVKSGYSFGNFRKKHYDNLILDFLPHTVSDAYLRNHGGFMLQPEIGVKIPLSVSADLLLTVAYRHQKTRSIVTQTISHGPSPHPLGEIYNFIENEWRHKASLNRLSFGVAIMFR